MEEIKCFKCKKSETESPKPLYACATCLVAGCWSSEFHLKAHFNDTHALGKSGNNFKAAFNVFFKRLNAVQEPFIVVCVMFSFGIRY